MNCMDLLKRSSKLWNATWIDNKYIYFYKSSSAFVKDCDGKHKDLMQYLKSRHSIRGLPRSQRSEVVESITVECGKEKCQHFVSRKKNGRLVLVNHKNFLKEERVLYALGDRSCTCVSVLEKVKNLPSKGPLTDNSLSEMISEMYKIQDLRKRTRQSYLIDSDNCSDLSDPLKLSLMCRAALTSVSAATMAFSKFCYPYVDENTDVEFYSIVMSSEIPLDSEKTNHYAISFKSLKKDNTINLTKDGIVSVVRSYKVNSRKTSQYNCPESASTVFILIDPMLYFWTKKIGFSSINQNLVLHYISQYRKRDEIIYELVVLKPERRGQEFNPWVATVKSNGSKLYDLQFVKRVKRYRDVVKPR